MITTAGRSVQRPAYVTITHHQHEMQSTLAIDLAAGENSNVVLHEFATAPLIAFACLVVGIFVQAKRGVASSLYGAPEAPAS